MSATTVQLLQAASEIVGGNRALALELGVSESLLRRFLSDSRELPDGLLLRAVDIILADRLSRLPGAPAGEASRNRDLSSEPEFLQNYGRGSGATFETGGGG
jgi:hypothetical protein